MAFSSTTAAATLAALKLSLPADETRALLLALTTLGAHLIPLSVINFHDLPAAQTAVVSALQTHCPALLARLDSLPSTPTTNGTTTTPKTTLLPLLTCAIILCAETHPMPLYYGFASSVLQDWSFATQCFLSPLCASLNEALASIKNTRKSYWLLKKVPAGMDRFAAHPEKIRQASRKAHEKAREDLGKRLERRGFPPFKEGISSPGTPVLGGGGAAAKQQQQAIKSFWIPFATWQSPFSLVNEGHSWDQVVRWQMDPGRLLHAFIVSGEVNIRQGELMLVPAGPGECLVRWLEGLAGVPFKLVAEGDLDMQKLSLSSATKNTLHFLDDRRDAYIIKDPDFTNDATSRAIASAQEWDAAAAALGAGSFSISSSGFRHSKDANGMPTGMPELDAVANNPLPNAAELGGDTVRRKPLHSNPSSPDLQHHQNPIVLANDPDQPAELATAHTQLNMLVPQVYVAPPTPAPGRGRLGSKQAEVKAWNPKTWKYWNSNTTATQ